MNIWPLLSLSIAFLYASHLFLKFFSKKKKNIFALIFFGSCAIIFLAGLIMGVIYGKY
ncbi:MULTISPECIES: hypothetical protein [Lactococcus]|uniref:hypothetical protein n=1 Tax=Lactococcus TaxID=1357 RepID=UPI0020410047|nr:MULTISPECIES: hypothetical protein [Lactococcus]